MDKLRESQAALAEREHYITVIEDIAERRRDPHEALQWAMRHYQALKEDIDKRLGSPIA